MRRGRISVCQFRTIRSTFMEPPGKCSSRFAGLARVELDDQLFLDRERDLFADRIADDRAGLLVLVDREPARDAAALERREGALDARRLLATRGELDLVVLAHAV